MRSDKAVFIVLLLCFPADAEAGLDLWTDVEPPAPNVSYYRHIVPGEDWLYAIPCDSLGATIGLYRRAHEGAPNFGEEILVSGSPEDVAVAGPADVHIVVSTKEEKLFYSSDGGQTFVDRTTGLPAGAFMHQVAAHESGVVYATVRNGEPGHQQGMVRSTDFGANWDFSQWCEDCFHGGFWELELLRAQPARCWTLFQDGFFETQVSRTVDGENWDMLSLPFSVAFAPAGFALDRKIDDRFYLMLSDRIWWFDGELYSGEAFPQFQSGGCMGLSTPVWDPGVVYAAGKLTNGFADVQTSRGEPYSLWSSVGEGIPSVAVPNPLNDVLKYDLVAAPTVRKLYLAVWGLDLLERTVSLDPSSLPPPSQSPGEDGSPVTPNPTRGRIDWVIELSRAERVTWAILNVDGRQIVSVPLSWKEAGHHNFGREVTPYLGKLPQGRYFLLATTASGEFWSESISLVR